MKTLIKLIILFSIITINLNAQLDIYSNKKYLQIKANELVNKGNYKEAIQMINKGIEKYPDNDYLISLLGRSYKELKDLEKAELYFQKALQINPNNEFALAYIEQTKKTKEFMKNETQEELIDFIKDKGVDFIFIFLGILAGEIIATFLFNCDSKNWRFLIFKLKLKVHGESFYSTKNLSILFYKYFFTSSCPLKNILIILLELIIIGCILVGFDFFNSNSELYNIKTEINYWNYSFNIIIYSITILFLFESFKIVIKGLKTKKDDIYKDIIEVIHKMYINENILEINDLIEDLSKLINKKEFESELDKFKNEFILKYIINEDEQNYLLSKL